MRIILLQDVPKLGRAGDVKTVSDGYARNFLFARRLADAATPENLARAKRTAEIQARKTAIEIERYRNLSRQLAATSLTFSIRVGERGKAFGSVTAQDIAAAAEESGIRIAKEWIELPHGLKITGTHTVPVKFPHGVTGIATIVIKPA